jgi:hypothetical protein
VPSPTRAKCHYDPTDRDVTNWDIRWQLEASTDTDKEQVTALYLAEHTVLSDVLPESEFPCSLDVLLVSTQM